MPSEEEHAVIGGLSGIGAYSAHQKATGGTITPEGLVGSAIIGALFGVMPDQLEPATSPKHRKTMHSLSVLVLCLGTLSNGKTLATKVAAAGFGSHIMADCTTPAGIPLI